MTKKTLSLILAALLMAQVLVGCGNSNGDTTTSADTSGATTEETIPDERTRKTVYGTQIICRRRITKGIRSRF